MDLKKVFKTYFTTMIRIVNRLVRSWGFHPVAFYVLASVVFITLSEILYYKTIFASWILMAIGLYVVMFSGDEGKFNFLSLNYGRAKARLLIYLESIILATPFLILLTYKSDWMQALTLCISLFVLSVFRQKIRIGVRIPTPFFRWPFEFIIGFRKAIPVVLIAAFIMIQACISQNYNLALFVTCFVVLIPVSFYSLVEDVYFVWIYSKTPQRFIFYKIKSGVICSMILASPFVLTALMLQPENWPLLFALIVYCLIYVAATVLAKYSVFPRQPDPILSIMMGVALILPPVLLIMLVFNYKKAIRSLQNVLI